MCGLFTCSFQRDRLYNLVNPGSLGFQKKQDTSEFVVHKYLFKTTLKLKFSMQLQSLVSLWRVGFGMSYLYHWFRSDSPVSWLYLINNHTSAGENMKYVT